MIPSMTKETRPRFAPGTTDADAQALTMAALAVIGGGWPVAYMRQSVLEGGQPTLDLDAMVAGAVALAVQVQTFALAANRIVPQNYTDLGMGDQ